MEFRFFEKSAHRQDGTTYKKLKGVILANQKVYFDVVLSDDAKIKFTELKGAMNFPVKCNLSELTSDKYFIKENNNNGYVNRTLVITSLDGVKLVQDEYDSLTLESFVEESE